MIQLMLLAAHSLWSMDCSLQQSLISLIHNHHLQIHYTYQGKVHILARVMVDSPTQFQQVVVIHLITPAFQTGPLVQRGFQVTVGCSIQQVVVSMERIGGSPKSISTIQERTPMMQK